MEVPRADSRRGSYIPKRQTKFDMYRGKQAVVTLVERNGAARSFHVANVSGLGVSDEQRANLMLNATTGKRLTYRRPSEGAHA